MRKRNRVVLLMIITFTLSVCGVTYQVADAKFDSKGFTATSTSESENRKSKGNAVARALGAPFRAIGNIFGGSKTKRKSQRLTKKDEERLEGTGIIRVTDSHSPATPVIAPPVAAVAPSAPDASSANTNAARQSLTEARKHLESGFVTEAITLLSHAASLDPHLAEAHRLLGVAYDRKGLRNLARESYERALRITPNDAQTLNNLGYSFYLKGDYRRAVERLKRASQLAPSDQRILNNLALAQFRLGKYDDALKSFVQANGEFTGRLNIASLFERTGYGEKAIEHYEVARRIQPNSSVVLNHLSILYRLTGRTAEAEATRRATSPVVGETATTTNGGN
ncbi:MAG: tetratricopeptide repeat protein [Pyrinomonadaceae bacterium]